MDKGEIFSRYDKVRRSGVVNMFDRTTVCKLANLTVEEYNYVVDNYNELEKYRMRKSVSDGWIDAKRYPPALDRCVIVCTKSNVFEGVRHKVDGKIFWTNAVWQYLPMEEHTGEVLYWRDFPELPRQLISESRGEE